MKWRIYNRRIHRDLGYFFFGMTLIYAVSGIVLNHRQPGGDASIVTRSEDFQYRKVLKEDLSPEFLKTMLIDLQISSEDYKNHFFQNDNNLMIYLKNGHISFDPASGFGKIITIRKRPVLTEFNFLHYNKPKKLWTWFSDIYAVALGLLGITGLFIINGKHSITRRGGILTVAGILIPLIFLYIYLWKSQG